MKYLHICFDLDGVLINSLNVMKISWSEVQKVHGIDQPFSSYKSYIGIPFHDILDRLNIPKRSHADIKKTYDKASLERAGEVQLFEGVREVLESLKKQNIVLSILTSKTRSRTHNILTNKEITNFFDYIICPEDLPKGEAKPSPKALSYVIELAEISRSQTLFLGDMHSDLLCAADANVDYCHCQYGYEPMPDVELGIHTLRMLEGLIK